MTSKTYCILPDLGAPQGCAFRRRPDHGCPLICPVWGASCWPTCTPRRWSNTGRYLSPLKRRGVQLQIAASSKKYSKTLKNKNYAVVADQLTDGLISIAIPVRGVTGEVVAAINKTGFGEAVTEELMVRERLPYLRIAPINIQNRIIDYQMLERALSRAVHD
ncbi:hypothetical protein FY036_07780 [Mesorhizobium microcysteis]|uniref:Uncharacterized protein n=1 Tax=Neoaquamicrobium microcysteis TaxID=2682781 RepID=A0A5D4H0K4_9HYPH|nr:hypothetical protein FY036_07780 [Mesorhizobium microcysteis]